MSSFGPSNEGITCRINLNGTGTISTRDSFNVSSVTDNGAGDYTTNFSTSHSNANYAMGGWCGYPASRVFVFGDDNAGVSYATSSLRMEASYVSGTNGEANNDDVTYFNMIIAGDI